MDDILFCSLNYKIRIEKLISIFNKIEESLKNYSYAILPGIGMSCQIKSLLSGLAS